MAAPLQPRLRALPEEAAGVPAATPSAHPEAPDWLSEHKLVQEVVAFFRTAVLFARSPSRFVERWTARDPALLNPISFMGISIVLSSIWDRLLDAVVQTWCGAGAGGPRSGVLGALLDSSGPYLHYLGLAILAHLVLVAGGSRRPLRSSVAAALYAGGGSMAAACAVLSTYVSALKLIDVDLGNIHSYSPVVTVGLAAAWLGLLAFLVSLARGLSALHDMRLSWALAATVVATTVSALWFGLVNPPGSYGFHLHFWPGVGFGFSM